MIRCNLPELLTRHRVKIKDLAERTGISYRSVLGMYNEENFLINLKHLNKICEVLDCNISDLYEYEKKKD